MNQPVNQKNINSIALAAVKDRFIRLPYRLGQFKDTQTDVIMSDPAILCDYYRKCGGNHNQVDAAYLLGCLDWIYGEAFQPSGPAILPGGLQNTWKPHTVQPSGNTVKSLYVQPFIEYMERMFPVEDEREYMMWWVAHAIRRPNQKIVVTPVLRSRQGVGKTFLVGTLMRGIMGRSADVCTLSDVVGTFQDALIGKTTLLIDECYIDKRRTSNVLKIYQSNPTLIINRKNLPQITIDNKINFMIASNDIDPVYFESSDRRFFIPQFIEYKVNQKESKDFISNLAHWLTDKNGFQLIRDYLEQIDLCQFQPHDPPLMTDAKKARMGWSLEEKLAEQIENLINGVNVVNVAIIKSHINIDSQQPISDRKIAAALEMAGCISKKIDTGVIHITPDGQAQGLSKNTQAKTLKEWLTKAQSMLVAF